MLPAVRLVYYVVLTEGYELFLRALAYREIFA